MKSENLPCQQEPLEKRSLDGPDKFDSANQDVLEQFKFSSVSFDQFAVLVFHVLNVQKAAPTFRKLTTS